MTDDLVKRLRFDEKEMGDPICGEAADRIETLETALRQFADENNWEEWVGWVGDGEPQEIARAALAWEKKDE